MIDSKDWEGKAKTTNFVNYSQKTRNHWSAYTHPSIKIFTRIIHRAKKTHTPQIKILITRGLSHNLYMHNTPSQNTQPPSLFARTHPSIKIFIRIMDAAKTHILSRFSFNAIHSYTKYKEEYRRWGFLKKMDKYKKTWRGKWV